MRTSTRLEEWRKRPDPFELGKIVGSMHTLAPEFQGKAERELRARAEEIRAGELDRARATLARLSDRERLAVESLTSQIVNKLLHLPTVRMKEAAAGADGTVYADAVRHLFGLDDER